MAKDHRMKPESGLNLTPFIDMITCLMFFLMMFAATIPVAIIDAPLPKVAATAEEVRKAKEEDKKALDLSIFVDARAVKIKSAVGGEKTFPANAGKYPYKDIHTYLVTLKTKRPAAREVTMIPSDDVIYETMIDLMDAARDLEKGDEGYKALPPEIASKPEAIQFNQLFPDVSIGGV